MNTHGADRDLAAGLRQTIMSAVIRARSPAQVGDHMGQRDGRSGLSNGSDPLQIEPSSHSDVVPIRDDSVVSTSTAEASDTLTPSRGPNPDAQAAARALLAILDHPDVATAVDERLFEALLVYALQSIPGLANNLFSCGDGVKFTLGKRGTQADVVGSCGGTVVVECEIKLHSHVNWTKNGECQLDNYADRAPDDAQFFLITAEHRLTDLTRELESSEVRGWPRWAMVNQRTVRDAVAHTVGPLPAGDGSAERLVRALARLVDTETPDF